MALKKTIVEPSWEAKYSFSPAVITEGGKTIWLAGHVGFVDDGGASLAGNFDAQTRQAFKNLEKTLQRAGGHTQGHSLDDRLGFGRTVLAALHRYSQGNLRKGIPGQHIADRGSVCRSGDHGRDHGDSRRRCVGPERRAGMGRSLSSDEPRRSTSNHSTSSGR